MRENDLHAHIFRESHGLAAAFPHVLIGPGDDCAALRTGRETLLATVDHVIEQRHFAAGTPLDAVARKALARSVSDIAAMCGTPLAALATAALPHGYPQKDAELLYDRLAHWGRHFSCPLVGGDAATFGQGTAAGPLTITVTALGTAHAVRGPVTRSGARPGDSVYVTGRLGGSLESGRHLTFQPRVREAAWLADSLGDRLHAMIDLSDGLGRDAGRVATASGVRIELEASLLPRNPGAEVSDALADGEDYELLFVAEGAVASDCTRTPCTRIGTVTAGEGCAVRMEDGRLLDASNAGWEHR